MKENEEFVRKSVWLYWLAIGTALLYNLTWFCFDFMHAEPPNQALTICYIVYLKLGNAMKVFVSPYITLFVIYLALMIINFIDKAPKKDKMKFLKWEFEPTKKLGYKVLAYSTVAFFLTPLLLIIPSSDEPTHPHIIIAILYTLLLLASITAIMLGGAILTASIEDGLDRKDAFNRNEESAFPQNEVLIETDDSVNLRTKYKYMNEIRHGWINIINPFRATMVLGTPGSGKSFAIINQMIRQQIAKGYCMYCYDYKFPTLSEIIYNNVRWNTTEYQNRYGIKPKFCVINFDDPRTSHRCNPIRAEFLTDQLQAQEIATIIALNLQKEWIKNQDFFAKSAISFLACVIWYLAKVENGKYCTFPHAIELICAPIEDTIPLLYSQVDLRNAMANFFESWRNGAVDQLSGQIASIQIPITSLVSDSLYWAMTGDDFTLDINNPDEPKILCLGNNPEFENIYGVALGLFNGRITKLVNKQHKLKCSIIVDELPTIYFMGLDTLIATARSNKVAVCLGFQDFSQLEAVYGKEEASKIIKTIGNIFSGQVFDETAKNLSERFGKNKQQKKSMSISDSGTSISISEQTDYMIPQSTISQLSQGKFVGLCADDFGKENDEKVFHCNIDVDMSQVKREENESKPMPVIKNFDDKVVLENLKKLGTTMKSDKKLGSLFESYASEISSAKTPKEILSVYDSIIDADSTKRVKKEVQKIRDGRMRDILAENHKKVASDIRDLIRRQIEAMSKSTESDIIDIYNKVLEKKKKK